METIKTNIVCYDNETGKLETILEYHVANRESSVRVTLSKKKESGINCTQCFTVSVFNERFSIK